MKTPIHFTWMRLRRAVQTLVASCAALGALTACHGLLDVSDPTYIRDQDVQSAVGANARRAFALNVFMSYFPSSAVDVALFTDEATYDRPIGSASIDPSQTLDQRMSSTYLNQVNNPTDDPHLANLDQYLGHATLALQPIRQYSPSDVKGDYLAQLFALRGVVILQMAEDMCPGFPINDVASDNQPLLSGPYTTDSAVAYAITQLDSALANVTDSAQYRELAHLIKGRALLDLGQFAAAATEVASVPTDFAFRADPSRGNPMVSYQTGDQQYGGQPMMADREGGNGLPFRSEHDTVRTPYGYYGQRVSFPTESLFVSLKYLNTLPDFTFMIATGVEARLIEAEAALRANDPSWLTTLNALRTPVGLSPLVDPGTDSARVDLVYHERAFWLYLTGRRLGDLRRLMRNYGRRAQDIFPTGLYRLGGSYGNETAIAFNLTAESQYNSKITTGCTTP